MVSIENRPRLLKDFLRDDSNFQSCPSPSSTSNIFTMYPRKKSPCKSMVQAISSKSTKPSMVLLRSRSKKATISAIHKVINVVKFIQLATVKSPVFLPRSISRKKLSNKSYYKDKNDILQDAPEVKVKVKDILRWRSFRDFVEDESTPLDFSSSPNRSITTTTISSCSKRSSWCDSDFTEEELPWCGENEEFLGKKCLLGQPDGTIATLLRNHKGECSCEDYEQQSPVSVLDTPFREVEKSISHFHPRLANIERVICNLTRRIQESEGFTEPKYARKRSFSREISVYEEKAKQLLSHVKESSLVEKNQNHADDLIFDFFMHELSINGKLEDVEFDCEVLGIAKSWINGENHNHECYEWEIEDKREAYVKDMEKGVCWKKFQQEQEEMSKELEMVMLNELLDEVLGDLLVK